MQHAVDGDIGKYDNTITTLTKTIGIIGLNKFNDVQPQGSYLTSNKKQVGGFTFRFINANIDVEKGEFKAINTANKVNKILGGKSSRTKINGFSF